jgi:hypothetical protein
MLVHGDFTACELKIQFFSWVLFFYFEYKSFDIFKFGPAFAAVVQYGRTIAATEITGVALAPVYYKPLGVGGVCMF